MLIKVIKPECWSMCSRENTLGWRHNQPVSVSNHQPHGCLLNRLFKAQINITSKFRATGLCEGNSPGTGEFPAQSASNAENVSIWRRHHVILYLRCMEYLWFKHDLLIWKLKCCIDAHWCVYSSTFGRCGSYIAVDNCIEQGKKENQVNIFKYTVYMRGRRVDMTQTLVGFNID